MKFTPKGGEVTVGMSAEGGDVEIFISDNGIGIAADFLPYVFDRFRQADSSTSRRHSGVGLGMAIVRHLVELHGGTVSVESAGEGQGATFRLRLPTRRAEVAPVQRVEPREPGSDADHDGELERLPGLHVLLVEDDTDTRNVLALLLQKVGALVEAVPSAKEAIDRVTSRRPDVLVSDIGMPEEDGYSLIRRLRQMPADIENKLPAIALTAYAGQQDAEAAIGAGYDCHLPKPVAPAALIRAIKSLMVP